MLRSILCDYNNTYILVIVTITVVQATSAEHNANKKVIFKNYALFYSCVSRMTNTQIDDAQYIDVVMPMYNLFEYSNDYSKTSELLWQYCIDEMTINAADVEIADFTTDNATTDSFNK